jgi:VIT1/CCC1 family predicted Fe2+/Mn2+ transporter
LKRLIVLASFAILCTPYLASAHDHHKRISANEMATAGFAAAAMIGVVGYLALRKRISL